jgi:tetratricopeptide (TPR) repeat protein
MRRAKHYSVGPVTLRAFLAVSVWLAAPSVTRAQNPVIDSLKKALRPVREDTATANGMNELSKRYWQISDYDHALLMADSALALSEKLRYKKGIAGAYTNTGIVRYRQGNYTEALQKHTAALRLFEEIGDKTGQATSHNNIGIVYKYLGNYPAALGEYFKALQLREEAGDRKGAAIAHNNIGNIYLNQGNHQDALRELSAALKIFEELNETKNLGHAHNNIGIVYKEMGDYARALKEGLTAHSIFERTGDKKGASASLDNIGVIHSLQGNDQEALLFFLDALRLKKEAGDKGGLAISYINIGNIYARQGRLKDARQVLNDALSLSRENGSLDGMMNSYNALMLADSLEQNYKGALENYKMYVLYRDSLVNEENTKKTVQQQMQYEFDKKEVTAKAEQDKKDAVTRIIIYSISGGLFLVLILAGFIFRGYRQKQKANMIITLQKAEVERQKQLVEEKQKDILDSIYYAKKIQLSLLPTEKFIDKHLRRQKT